MSALFGSSNSNERSMVNAEGWTRRLDFIAACLNRQRPVLPVTVRCKYTSCFTFSLSRHTFLDGFCAERNDVYFNFRRTFVFRC